jgi:hypothetical protein
MVWAVAVVCIVLLYLYLLGRRAQARDASQTPSTRGARPTLRTGASRQTLEAEAAVYDKKPRKPRTAAVLPPGAVITRVSGSELHQFLGADETELRRMEYEGSRGLARDTYALVLSSGQKVLIRHSPGYDWIDIITSGKRADYSRISLADTQLYGFSIQLSRWSFGEGPHGAREIRAALRVLEPTIQGRERW